METDFNGFLMTDCPTRLEKLFELQEMQPPLFAGESPTLNRSAPKKKSGKTTEEMLNYLTSNKKDGDHICEMFNNKKINRPDNDV